MDFLKVKRSRNQGGTKHIINAQQDKRGRTNTERPFFLRIVRKGKRNNNPNERIPRTTHKERGQAEDKQKTTGAERTKRWSKEE